MKKQMVDKHIQASTNIRNPMQMQLHGTNLQNTNNQTKWTNLQQSQFKYKTHYHGDCSKNSNLDQELCIQNSFKSSVT